MTIKQLKQAIADLPDEMDVFIEEMETGFQFGFVENAFVREISFMEDVGEKPICKANVLILTDRLI